MSEGFILVLVGIIGLVVGFAIGLAVGALRSSPGAPVQSVTEGLPTTAEPTQAAPPPAAPPTPLNQETEPLAVVATPVQGPELKRPSLNPINVLARAIQSEVPNPHQPDRSIAVQVDEILQEMLKSSPLANRAIRLMELPQKGMVVMIGLDQFDGVESVPDEEIRQILRAAVAEWERRVSGQEK